MGLVVEAREQERDTLGWEDVTLPAGCEGLLVFWDAAAGKARVVESPGMDARTIHHYLLEAARASYAPDERDAHALALDTAWATWEVACVIAAAMAQRSDG